MNDIHLSFWDLALIGLYVLILIVIGFRQAGKSRLNSPEDYLLANRGLTLPAFVATLVTTWYGGILGVGEFTYLYGLSSWVIFGLPYYFFAVLFALLLVKRIRASKQVTIPEMFYKQHGKTNGLIASLFLMLMTTPAPYILMTAFLLQVLLGWSFLASLLAATLFSTVYVFSGGFRSVVRTDKLQFLLMFAGFILLLVFAWIKIGPPLKIIDHLEPRMLIWHGGNSVQYIIVWFFLASWTFIDPGFHQRCAAAGSVSVARKGILVSVFFWFIFDLLTVSTGLYAAVYLQNINPVLSFPLLADSILPPVLKGLFFTGLLAIIMSTIDSFTFLSAMTFGNDIMPHFSCKKNQDHIIKRTRAGLLLTALIAIGLCILFPSVVRLWYVIGSIFIPPMLLPLLSAYFPAIRISNSNTTIAMAVSFVISLLWLIKGQLNSADGWPQYPLGLEPFIPGVLASIIIFGFFRVARGNR